MYIPSYNTVKKICDSPYKLSLLVAMRARELNAGAKAHVPSEGMNNVTVALKEIVDGYILEDKK